MSATKKKTLYKEKDEVVSSNSALKNFGLRKRTKGVVEKKSETKKNKVDPLPDPVPPTEFEVEQIVGKQIVSDIVFYQVKWKGFSLEETTWEPEGNLENAPMKIRDYENSLLEKKKPEKKTPNKKDIKAVTEPQKLLGKRSKAKEEEEEVEDGNDDDDAKKGKKEPEINHIPEKKKKGRPKKVIPSDKTPNSTPSVQDQHYNDENVCRMTKLAHHHELGFIEEEKKEVFENENLKLKNKDQGDEKKQNHILEEKQRRSEIHFKEKETSIENKLPEISDERRAQTPSPHSEVSQNTIEKEKMNDSGLMKTSKLHLKIHRNVNEYGSFAKGDTPVKVIGVRHTKEKPDLEVMVAWKLRDDGSQPINSKVSRLELLQKGFWLPLIQFYESKMKMENSPDFNPDFLPKM